MTHKLSVGGEPVLKYFDLETLTALKAAKGTLALLQLEDKQARFTAQNCKVTLPYVSASEVIDLTKELEVGPELSREEFRRALAIHTYGAHHNPQEAERRAVRIFSHKGHLLFQSYDKQASAFSAFPYSGPEVDMQLLPKPLLGALQVSGESFSLGSNFHGWKLESGSLAVWFPNLVKTVKGDFGEILKEIREKPCFKLVFSPGALDTALGQLAPFAKQKDIPKVLLQVVGSRQVILKTMSAKVSSVEVEIPEEDFKLEIGENLSLSGKETVAFNYRYLREFVTNLGKKEGITLQWWEHLDPNAPLKGRALSLFAATGRYLCARLAQ
jgi:hypothetical protein